MHILRYVNELYFCNIDGSYAYTYFHVSKLIVIILMEAMFLKAAVGN